ncbi:glycosyltransferase [Kordiimonas pumila]|uniref:Glycosyltransferase n=1 Tax=Kordiimonas pumila TaxID=2161677 RepID=A0ABV7D3S5_9PROT|nr:glycosyltransferase [Kordiimonas pumila]
MQILFVHNNFPGQYKRISEYLKDKPGFRMTAATLEGNKQPSKLIKARYKPHREATKGVHPALVSSERAVLMGHAAYSGLLPLKQKGFKPDIILSHSGWGASLFLKDLFPDAKLLTYFEWYYHCHGSDGEFFRSEPYGPNEELRLRMKNTPILHDLAAMDWGQSPTQFQHGKLPAIFKKNVSVLHDGVDIDFFSPAEGAKIKVKDGKVLTANDEVITYVARGMEDYRGFPQFMEAVSVLQKQRPNLHVVILGSDRVAYGSARPDGKSFKTWALETFEFDHSRLHFMGLQPLAYMRDMLRLTSAHIYLTAPFVLSWSLMEAMSTGALIVGSDTEPLHEVVTHGENGLLVPFFEVDKLVSQVNQVLDTKNDYNDLRTKARQTIVEAYSTHDLLPKYKELIETVANGSHITT